jgi:hypothetical protein
LNVQNTWPSTFFSNAMPEERAFNLVAETV